MSSTKFSHRPKLVKKYTKYSKYPHKQAGYTGPEYFSCEEEKKKFCDGFKTIRRNEISFTCPEPDSMGDVKSESVIEDIMRQTKKTITDAVIVEEIVGGEGRIVRQIRMVLKIKSKNRTYLSSFFWSFYKVFPDYHYKIQIDITNTLSYLGKARDLISPKYPLGHIEIDKDPFVYDERLEDIMTRMENAERGVCGSREINLSYTQELIDAAKDASGCWTRFIKKDVYRELSEQYPYHLRSAFDFFSSTPLKGLPEDPLFPTYFQCHFGNDVIEEIKTLHTDYSKGYTQEEQELSYDEHADGVREEHERMEKSRKKEWEIELEKNRKELYENYIKGGWSANKTRSFS